MDFRVVLLASVLCVSGAPLAQAQDGFFFSFNFFSSKPVPPTDIPSAPPSGTEAPFAAPSTPLSAPDGGSADPISLVTDGTSAPGAAALAMGPDAADSAANAALSLASPADAAPAGVNPDDPLQALEAAADQGQPIAMWRLGTMYESGEGVQKDDARAFGYFSRLADENANSPPRSLEAEIVARSFVKVGEYYRQGLPDAGIPKDAARSVALLMHAATYFADAQAQYEIGRLYLSGDGLAKSSLQGARWLSLAARKGHAAAQARLGDLLFNGDEADLPAQPVEGLMWLTIAHDHVASGSEEAMWIDDLLTKAMSIATPEERTAAIQAAAAIGPQVSGG